MVIICIKIAPVTGHASDARHPRGTGFMSNGISCLLPLRKDDFSRFLLLRRTLDAFLRFDTVISVVVPDDQCDEARSLVGQDTRYAVWPETSLLPALKAGYSSGWRKQQAIKLAFHEFCETEFYLTLDSDCIAVRPIEAGDLNVNGRGIVHYESREAHEEWYAASSILLDMGFPPGDAAGVTPFVMSREISRRLCEHLRSLADDPWKLFLDDRNGCTEYTLYHIYGYNAQLWDLYHCRSRRQLYGNCIWHREEADNWHAAKSFESPDFFFSVIQSNTGLTPDWTWDRIRSYVEAHDQRRE